MFELMKKEKNIIVGPKQESLAVFLNQLKKNYPGFFEKNIIIDLSDQDNLKTSDLLSFLSLAQKHNQNNSSFVIIAQGVNIDSIPEELIVAPSMIEALDIIEMDEISRDLGF